MRYIEGVDRRRKISFPEYIDDYITDENSMRVIEAFVDSLDIVELEFTKSIGCLLKSYYEAKKPSPMLQFGELNADLYSLVFIL